MYRLLILTFTALLLTSPGYAPTVTQAQDMGIPPFALRGDYPVGVVDLRVENGEQPLDVTMWYPALNPDGAEESVSYQLHGLQTTGTALRDAAPDIEDGPYPVIYYSHGLLGARLESTYYTEHLASWGFVVLAVDHTGSTFFNTTSPNDVIQSFGRRPLEIMQLVTFSEALNETNDYAGLMDMENLAVTGWSFGGYTSLLAGGASMDTHSLSDSCVVFGVDDNLLCEESYLQLLAETMNLDAVPDGLWPVFADERIKAIVPLAPCCVEFLGAEGLSGITAPIMVIVGTHDESAPAELNGIPAFEEADSTSKTLVLLQDAGHVVFLDNYDGEITQAHNLIKHLATAFFLSHLKNDEHAAAMLEPSSVDFAEVEYFVITP